MKKVTILHIDQSLIEVAISFDEEIRKLGPNPIRKKIKTPQKK
ncbi:MAG: hypothetical protein ACTSQX_16770 [Candidatus Heimdallarchaeota archaeon]